MTSRMGMLLGRVTLRHGVQRGQVDQVGRQGIGKVTVALEWGGNSG